MITLARADFDYGNARLRVRKGALLDRSTYDRLLELDLEGVLGALADGPYGSELESAGARYSGLRALHDAVRERFARSLEEMRAMYAGSARALVDRLLSRWDLHNLLTLLRGRAAGAGIEEVLAGVVPIGTLDLTTAAEVAGHDDADRAVEILVSRHLPGSELAGALQSAWPAYVRTQDLAALEHAIVNAHFAGLRAALAGFGRAGAPLLGELERELDVRNLLLALRLRAAREPRPSGPAPFIAGGSIRFERLDGAVHAAGEAEALALLSAAVHDEKLRAVLRSSRAGEGLSMLQEQLENVNARAAVGLFTAGDPLGIAVPIAFAAAQEAEARNLRLIGESLSSGGDRTRLAARLLVVGS